MAGVVAEVEAEAVEGEEVVETVVAVLVVEMVVAVSVVEVVVVAEDAEHPINLVLRQLPQVIVVDVPGFSSKLMGLDVAALNCY